MVQLERYVVEVGERFLAELEMGVMAKKCWYFSNALHWNTSETPLMIGSTESRLLKVFLPLLNGFNNSRRKLAVYHEILANLPTLFGIYSRNDTVNTLSYRTLRPRSG